MSVIVCGVRTGRKKKYSCPCCQWETDNIEALATSMCWSCVMGNLLCENCISDGVGIDKFDSPKGRLHRFARWQYEQSITAPAVTACGLLIERANIGHATAVRTPCRRCWKDDDA